VFSLAEFAKERRGGPYRRVFQAQPTLNTTRALALSQSTLFLALLLEMILFVARAERRKPPLMMKVTPAAARTRV